MLTRCDCHYLKEKTMTKRLAVLLLMVSGLMVLTGCKSKEDKLMEESMDTMEELASVMETIKDADSAKAAKPKLEKLFKRLEELGNEGKALNLSKEEQEALEKKHKERMEKVSKEFLKQMLRVMMNPKVAGELGDVMENAPKK